MTDARTHSTRSAWPARTAATLLFTAAGCLSQSVLAQNPPPPPDLGEGRFDNVQVYGTYSGLQLTRANGTLEVDDPGYGVGINASKSLFRSVYLTGELEATQLSNVTFRGESFEINRARIGFGGHSREDLRLIGFWEFDYQAIQYYPTPPNGDRDTEDGYRVQAGVIYKLLPRVDLFGAGAYMGLDEMNGGETSGGVRIALTPRFSVEGLGRYTYLRDNDDDEFELFAARLGVSYRFGGPTLASMVFGER